MDEKKIKFLQDINNGTIKGAQKIIAQKLKISDTSVSLWFRNNKKPSIDSILKMSKAFKKSEEEIKEIFSVEESSVTNSNTTRFADAKDVKILEERMKRFETEFDYMRDKIKILETKIK